MVGSLTLCIFSGSATVVLSASRRIATTICSSVNQLSLMMDSSGMEPSSLGMNVSEKPGRSPARTATDQAVGIRPVHVAPAFRHTNGVGHARQSALILFVVMLGLHYPLRKDFTNSHAQVRISTKH